MVFLESCIVLELGALGLNTFDHAETDKDKNQVETRVQSAEMDHLRCLYEFVQESIETAIIKADDQESIDSSNRVVRLSLLDVGVICAHKNE